MALSTIACLGAIEIGLRLSGWVPPFQETKRVVPGTVRRLETRRLRCQSTISHRTDEFEVTYRTNAWGYFDREWTQAKDPVAFRLAFLGDSFTMGHGVPAESTFVRRLEALLTARVGRTVETMNFGIWGSGTLHEMECLPDILRFSPDLVVLCFYVNDVFDNQLYRARADSAHAPAAPAARESFGQRFRRTLSRQAGRCKLRTLAFVAQRTRNLRGALGLINFDLESVFRGGADDLLAETALVIDEMNTRLRGQASVPLVVVYLPAQVQVRTVRAPRGFDLYRPNRILASLIGEIPWLDMTGDLRGLDTGGAWFREGHLTARGHHLVADWLADELPEHMLRAAVEDDEDERRQRRPAASQSP